MRRSSKETAAAAGEKENVSQFAWTSTEAASSSAHGQKEAEEKPAAEEEADAGADATTSTSSSYWGPAAACAEEDTSSLDLLGIPRSSSWLEASRQWVAAMGAGFDFEGKIFCSLTLTRFGSIKDLMRYLDRGENRPPGPPSTILEGFGSVKGASKGFSSVIEQGVGHGFGRSALKSLDCHDDYGKGKGEGKSQSDAAGKCGLGRWSRRALGGGRDDGFDCGAEDQVG